MESSINRTLSIKGSEADFTLPIASYGYGTDQNIYHFGGFNDWSVEVAKIDETQLNKSDTKIVSNVVV